MRKNYHDGVTTHAAKRLRQRVGITKKSFERQVELVLERGKDHTEFDGKFRHYLDNVFNGSKADILKVYGHHIYLMAKNHDPNYSSEVALITTFAVPLPFRSTRKKMAGWEDDYEEISEVEIIEERYGT